jgi:RimJ/RimL family protein N-acetyltransferase
MDFRMKPIRRFLELTEDWRHFAKRDGLKSSLALITSDIARLPLRHLKFVIAARSLTDPFPDIKPGIELFIRPFSQDDLDLVRQIDRPSEARLCAQRLAQGHIGLIAFFKDQPAGYAWGSTDIHTRLERVHPPLTPGDVLCTDSYTSPTFRGKGIQTALTLARFHLFRELGYCRAICTIEERNKPSLAVWQRKLNSQVIGYIDFRRIGPWYRIRYS